MGVKRPGFGTQGRAIDIQVNCYKVEAADVTVYQYDGMSCTRISLFPVTHCIFQLVGWLNSAASCARLILSCLLFLAVDPDALPTRVNMEIFRQVQQDHPGVFTGPLSYDGRKIAYATYQVPMGTTSRTVGFFFFSAFHFLVKLCR
jgi:eukaryotic translation initiation factor 2C